MVGGAGNISRFDGTGWIKEVSGTGSDLYAVWAVDASDVWAVGSGGTIVRRSGGKWQVESSGTSAGLLAVFGTDMSNAYAVGEQGTILHRGASSWSSEPSGALSRLWGVMGDSTGTVWAVGASGQILQRTSGSWRSVASGTMNDLFSGLCARQPGHHRRLRRHHPLQSAVTQKNRAGSCAGAGFVETMSDAVSGPARFAFNRSLERNAMSEAFVQGGGCPQDLPFGRSGGASAAWRQLDAPQGRVYRAGGFIRLGKIDAAQPGGMSR
jgi:hypothetical protein